MSRLFIQTLNYLADIVVSLALLVFLFTRIKRNLTKDTIIYIVNNSKVIFFFIILVYDLKIL